jgi:acetyl esterase/lipase
MNRSDLYALLGDLPDRRRVVTAETFWQEERANYWLEKVVLDLNGIQPVPAYFVRPKNQTGRAPAVLYNHAHGGDYQLGKDELVEGRKELQKPPYADVLASAGCCALCFDAWAFGERGTRRESEIFKDLLWHGRVMWGMMVYDSLRAIDYLATRPDVDAARIATLGMSMGSTMAWWVAALDERVKVTVDICCLTDFQSLLETNHLKGHGLYYYVPSLLKHFTTARINALIAPRAHLSLAGNLDPLTPPDGLDRIDRELTAVYAAAGKPENWRLFRQDTGHEETPEMRAEAIRWLNRFLVSG